MSAPADDPILKRFRAALDEIYGDRAERVVLFGSRVRGDAHEDSDYDVAVFLRDMTDRAAEMNRLADLSTKIIVDEDGPFIHAMPFRAGSYNEPTPLMHEIRTGGVDLWNRKPLRFDMELRAFLGRTYNLKAIADYETSPGSQVTFEQAQEAINTAGRLIGCIAEFLA